MSHVSIRRRTVEPGNPAWFVQVSKPGSSITTALATFADAQAAVPGLLAELDAEPLPPARDRGTWQ